MGTTFYLILLAALLCTGHLPSADALPLRRSAVVQPGFDSFMKRELATPGAGLAYQEGGDGAGHKQQLGDGAAPGPSDRPLLSRRDVQRAKMHLAHKIADFMTTNRPYSGGGGGGGGGWVGASSFLQVREDPVAGYAEPGPAGSKECRRILSTWMAKCTFGTAGGDKNLPGGEEKKPALLLR